jgi:hypothetical protein
MEDVLRYRELNLTDYDEIKQLHELLFPVRYSDHFFNCIVRGKGLNHQPIISRVAIDISTSYIIGFIIAQFNLYSTCDDENLLDKDAKEVCYIMTLGTKPEYARTGDYTT